MDPLPSFSETVGARLAGLRPAERRVVRYLQDNREAALMASASALAERAGTSDATVIRTAKALGYSGLGGLRLALADELRGQLSQADRVARTLSAVGAAPGAALEMTLEIHRQSLEALRRDLSPADFEAAVQAITGARRVFAFGIGPSSAMAEYLVLQLGRFGLDASALVHTGLLLADGLRRLRRGDLLLIFAYGRIYRELATLLDHAGRCGVGTVLVTDTLGPRLRGRVDLLLPVARGRADMLSMHTTTLGLIEALLVGVASNRPAETVASLEALNALRAEVDGQPMDLPGLDSPG